MRHQLLFRFPSTITFLLLMILACGGQPGLPQSDSQQVIIGVPVNTPTSTLTTPSLPTPAPAALWQEFTSEALGFAVLLPGSPTQRTRPFNVVGANSQMTLYSVTGRTEAGKSYTYLVGQVTFPPLVRSANQIQIEQLLNNAQNDVISNLEANLVDERAFVLAGYPGREIELETDQLRIIYRFLLADASLYHIAANIHKATDFSTDDYKFLDSFTLLETPISLAEPVTNNPTATPQPTEALPPTSLETVVPWQSFSPSAGDFSALLPAVPEEVVHPLPDNVGELRIFTTLDELSGTMYLIMYSDLPNDLFDQANAADIERMLDQGRDSGLANVEGMLISEKSITLEDHPGRQIIFEMPDSRIPGGGRGVAQFYLVDNRLYQLMIMGSKDRLVAGDIARFLDSFQLSSE